MKLILTDVDGTLTRKSLVLSHAGYLIEKGIIKDDGSYKAWSSDLKNESLIMAVAQNYRKEIIGLTLADMDAKNFVRGFYKNQNNWYSTLDEIEQRILVGDKVVLITGSSDFLVKELATILGADYYATEYVLENGKFTGNVNGMFSENQKDDCIQWNINVNQYSYITGLGDTASDYGIFKHCDYKILVEPSQETLKSLIQKTIVNEIR